MTRGPSFIVLLVYLYCASTNIKAHTHTHSQQANDETAGFVDTSFLHGFVASLSVIIVSELGDKTFFIAAIMAMQHSRYAFLA